MVMASINGRMVTVMKANGIWVSKMEKDQMSSKTVINIRAIMSSANRMVLVSTNGRVEPLI